MEPINIVCLKWGAVKYGPEYVNKLYAGFKRHTTIPFKFHCFTERTVDINPDITTHQLPCANTLEGWWNKVYLFSKEVNLEGRLFFVDLDTLIVGNVDHIISHNTGFVMLRDFFRPTTGAGSGLMSFDARTHSHIWENFAVNPLAIASSIRPHGDQVWIMRQQQQRVYWQDLFPNQVVSYKVHCRNGLPADARIVCYHGKPSIPDSITKTTQAQQWVFPPAPWVADHWRE